MLICRVIGSGVATVKDAALQGLTLLVVQEIGTGERADGPAFIAADTVGAGYGEAVLVSTGGGARRTERTKGACVDAAITGILDHLEVHGVNAYRRGSESPPRPGASGDG